jgi:uncharacterized protein (TIGR01777 family)
MKVLISGAGGLVGSALEAELGRRGEEARALERGRAGKGIGWEPQSGAIDLQELEVWRPQALVHLAGENIAARRWSPEQKRRIRESRVEATQKLVESLLRLSRPPEIFVGASAVGIYGSRGDEILTEESPAGDGFLGEVAESWEKAAEPLRAAGTRVVHLRFGMILSRNGGALPRMVPLFKLGLGGKIGSGRQWMSWIALADVVRLIRWALENPRAAGAYNAVAPEPVTNAEFTRCLANVLGRWAILPVPRMALRAAFGEMADALLLASQRVIPKRLRDEGFTWAVPSLGQALEGWGAEAPSPRAGEDAIDHVLSQSYALGAITALEHTAFRDRLEHSLESAGFRFTRQRREVFDVVAESHDHPTADDIFERVKRKMPEISFATVYNCLSVLVRCGLLRQVTLDRSPTRFCPNMREHGHFFCERCGEVTDIAVPQRSALAGVDLPPGFEIASFDISMRGVCPTCADKAG